MPEMGSDLLKILNQNNLLILNQLQKNIPLSSLTKTKSNPLVLNRDITLLDSFGLLKKENDHYNSTKLGDLILKKFQGMAFLSKHHSFFTSHSFDDIPNYLLIRIEDLSGCEFIHSIWPTATRLKKIVSDSSTFLNCIFTQPPFLLADLFYEKIHDRTKLKLLFGQNSSIPDCNDLVEKLKLNKLTISNLFEKRLCDRVISNVVVSDKGACLMLGNRENTTDMMNAIMGYDKQFINWCNDFFDYKWKTGENFARLRVSK